MMEWVNTILQGVMIGGLYAMFAAGLSLIFGVMKLVNVAHGDFIVLAAYVALVIINTLGINPLLSLVIVLPIMAIIGYAIQRGLLNQTLGDDRHLGGRSTSPVGTFGGAFSQRMLSTMAAESRMPSPVSITRKRTTMLSPGSTSNLVESQPLPPP